MQQRGRISTLVLMLVMSALLCSAKADKSNEPSSASKSKASSVKPSSASKAKPETQADQPAARADDGQADIPLFPQQEVQDSADLNNGVTATANIAASPAPGKAAASGSGSVKVSGDSRLAKPVTDPATVPFGNADLGDAIIVGSNNPGPVSSFREASAGPSATGAPLGIGNPATPAVKPPATKPTLPKVAAKPAPKSQAAPNKPAAGAKPSAKQGAQSPAAKPKVPSKPVEQPADTAPNLEHYFADEEVVSGSVAAGDPGPSADPASGELEESSPPDRTQATEALIIGSASSRPSTQAKPRTLADAIQDKEEVGNAVPKVNPVQSILSLAAVLALFIALAAVYGKLKGRKINPAQRLNVIEEIGLGQGRQILIVEVMGDALVLGMTPQSINLLDKVPVDSFASDYRGSVDAILAREANQPRRWAERPAFRSELRSALNVPRATAQAVPSRQIRIGDLRADRRPVSAVHAVLPASDRQSKNELIDRIREQLQRLED